MSNQAEVEASYDVDNDFFKLWLDEKMNYTCAEFDRTDNLEQAQLNKLESLCLRANVDTTHHVLDIGCGWGAALEYLVLNREVAGAHGITLSRAQAAEVSNRNLPRVNLDCVSYLDFQPALKFDAILSICMMEHIATPAMARAGSHIEAYRNYFRLAHSWTKPGAQFALQTILRKRVPRDPADLRELGWITYQIFPGGISLRLEDIIQSVEPWWEIMDCKTRRDDYRKTTMAWLQRLEENKAIIVSRWGSGLYEQYRRYLSGCVDAFEKNYQSLAQWTLRRID